MSSPIDPPLAPMPSLEEEGDPLAGIPTLSTITAQSTEDKISALRLIADSIAQQRQLAARALIFHPVTLSAHIVLLAVISQLLYSSLNDLPLILTTAVGITMAALLGVRYAVQEYLSLAEQINFAWLRRPCYPDGEEEHGELVAQDDDRILITKFGDEVIGTLVLRLVPASSSSSSTGENNTKASKKRRGGGGKGVIRAWTVRLKYRRKGVGRDLLDEGVRLVREGLGHDATVMWAKDHASQFVFPSFPSGG